MDGSRVKFRRCQRCGKEKKRGGGWVSCRLVFDTAGKRGNEAACGLHATSSWMPQERGETRRRVGSMPPRLRRPRKEWKRGSVWTPHRLVFDATGRRNEAACGFHAVSSSMPQQGGETTRRRVGFTRPRCVLGSSLVPPQPPRCSPRLL